MIGSGSIFSAALALVGIAPRNLSPMPVSDNGRPTMAVSPRKPGASVPEPIQDRSGTDLGSDMDPIRTCPNKMITLNPRKAQPVRITGFSDGILRVSPARYGTGPKSIPEAVSRFTNLIREAIGNGYLPDEIRFSGLSEYYQCFVRDFGWPEISDKRLSMLLVANGCQRMTKRVCERGWEKKYRAFRFPDFDEEAQSEAA